MCDMRAFFLTDCVHIYPNLSGICVTWRMGVDVAQSMAPLLYECVLDEVFKRGFEESDDVSTSQKKNNI